jgi:signal recognition particle receptor subunit beta
MLKKKICMLGYYAVGKTSLVSQFVNHLFADKYQTTVGVKIDKKTVQVTEIGRLPFLLLVNKADERAGWEIPDKALADLAARGWTVLKTSANTGEKVEEAFLTLSAAMLKVQDEGDGEDDG